MIEITLGDIGTICGYLGTIWCVANLLWGLFRNDAYRVLIYGIGTFAAIIVMLNVGGILNETTWGIFGCLVFGIHTLYAAAVGHAAWKVAVYGILLAVSLLSVVGVIRRSRCSAGAPSRGRSRGPRGPGCSRGTI